MKKVLAIAAALVLGAATMNAQSVLDALKNAAGSVLGSATEAATTAATEAGASSETAQALGGILGDILGQVLNTVTTVSLPGTWTYNGAASAVQSENTLVSLGASAYKTKIDNFINKYLKKVGITPGAATFTFGTDGSFTIANSKKTIATGTYTTEGNKITMQFGSVYKFLTLEGTTAITTDGCQLLFDATRFLTFIKQAVAVAGKFVNVGSAASLVSELSGLQLGFSLVK